MNKENKAIIKAVKIEDYESDGLEGQAKNAVDQLYELTYKRLDKKIAQALMEKIKIRLAYLEQVLDHKLPFIVAALDVLIEEDVIEEPRLIEKKLVSDLAEIAIYDKLTGLYKRSVFDSFLDMEIKKHKRLNKQLSLAMMDIDDFKRVNDEHGHLVGDEVLHGIGDLITSLSRLYDVECRYGGEEIAIILPDTDLASAYDCMERIRKDIESLFLDEAYQVTVSVGIAELMASDTRESIIEASDQALYEAKAKGKNQCIISKR